MSRVSDLSFQVFAAGQRVATAKSVPFTLPAWVSSVLIVTDVSAVTATTMVMDIEAFVGDGANGTWRLYEPGALVYNAVAAFEEYIGSSLAPSGPPPTVRAVGLPAVFRFSATLTGVDITFDTKAAWVG